MDGGRDAGGVQHGPDRVAVEATGGQPLCGEALAGHSHAAMAARLVPRFEQSVVDVGKPRSPGGNRQAGRQ